MPAETYWMFLLYKILDALLRNLLPIAERHSARAQLHSLLPPQLQLIHVWTRIMLGSLSICPVLGMVVLFLYEALAFTSCIQQELISGNLWVHVQLLVKNSVGASASFREMSQEAKKRCCLQGLKPCPHPFWCTVAEFKSHNCKQAELTITNLGFFIHTVAETCHLCHVFLQITLLRL